MKHSFPALALLMALAGAATPRPVQAAEAVYDRQLIRLAEVLGSLQYLRALCGEQNAPWRARMEALLEAEKPDPDRRARMVAAFNHGYSAFEAVYRTCTPSAIAAINRYMKEGEELTTGIVERYGR
ncbi:TIGR02301 family protein [Chelativorans composti]|jgi:TIGR02301 family protein|uniref:TIGR02301 family protein n=1 Tax=Chelativorans composti TaxID=768533 RepID=A0ABW5DFP1_9HYPH|nr:TIGR02301 family protein [bacterium SGD-2]